MTSSPGTVDHYRVLGVAVAAGAAEIRRAYRLLALRHHPDRAGPGGTAQFQLIAEAYRVLSNTSARARYDAQRRPHDAQPRVPERAGREPVAQARDPNDPDFAGPYRERRHVTVGGSATPPDLIARLSGPLQALIDSAAVRQRPDGSLELLLHPPEIARGGTSVITLPFRIACGTCGGVAQKNKLWCARCEFEGMVTEEVTVCVSVPRHVADGTGFRVAVDPMSVPLRVWLRHA